MLTDASRLQDFPSLSNRTYLNTAAEGIPSLPVGRALTQYFEDHQLGMDGRGLHFAQLEALKANIAAMYNLPAENTAVCSCSSEAYNMAARALQLGQGDEVILNDLDYPAGCSPWLLESSRVTTRLWKSRDGALHLEDLQPLLSDRTRLVAVSLVSFFNGFKLDLPATASLVRQRSESLISVDVTQALGRIELAIDDADLVVSSTHKWILATHGGGLVGVRPGREKQFTCQAGGWFNLKDAFGDDRFEHATPQAGAPSFAVGMPNFPAIYAINAALGYIQNTGVTAIVRHADPLVAHCLDELKKLPVELISPADPSQLAGILAFRHPDSARINQALQQQNIHIMEHAGRLRVAIHGYNTQADVNRFLEALAGAIKA